MILDTAKYIKVENKYFQYWQESADFTVNKIFDFSESLGNSSLSECTDIVLSYLNNNPYVTKYTFNTSDEISLLKSIINYYIDSRIWIYDPAFLRGTSPTFTVDNTISIHQSFFLLASHCAINLYQISLDKEISRNEIIDTIIRKQKDYGPNNVSKFGIWGLVVRVHDKIARLDNLLSKNNWHNNAVSNESVYDTMLDIIGYASVAILWLNGWFLLPMEKSND